MAAVHRFIATAAASIAVSLALSACGTVMTTAESGFLSDYGALAWSADTASARRAAEVAIDPAQVRITEVAWRADDRAAIPPDERRALLAHLQQQLQERIQALPAAPEGRPALIRAAITWVETVSPALNTLGTLLLIGPLDRGGAAVEIEAVDPRTGHQLAALSLGHFAPLSEFKARFSTLAPADIALRKAATEFASLLRPAAAVSNLECNTSTFAKVCK